MLDAMLAEDIADQLASLNIDVGRSSTAGKSSTPSSNTNKGGGAIMRLRSHLTRLRIDASSVGSSPNELRKGAKNYCRGLFKIAQVVLRNRAGGSEPLHLACEAMHMMLPLYSFAGAADLAMEKLWYQAIARCVDLDDFLLGIRATASLQICLNKRWSHGYTSDGATRCLEGVQCCPAFEGAEDDGLILRSFPPPAGNSQLDVALLVSGASLNACRCCLEVGSKEALLLVTGELGRSAGMWVDRVSELGQSAKSEAHRDHLFKLLWRACSVLEQPSIGATARQCLVGRQTALNVLLRKTNSWSVDSFVAHAHRSAVALESSPDDCARAGSAVQLSDFCLKALKDREGVGWPAGTVEAGGVHSGWVEWLQYCAGLYEKVGDRAEAQRLLQLAYEYVRRYMRRQGVGAGRARVYRAASCAAYASVLKVHAAATITAQHPPSPRSRCSSIVAGTPSAKNCAKQRAAKGADASPDHNRYHAIARVHMSKALEYVGDVCEALGVLAAAAEDASTVDVVEGATVFVGAALKAWKWAQKACSIISLWTEREQAGDGKTGGCDGIESVEWSELNAKAHGAVGDLSRMLAACSRCAGGRVFERIPPARSISVLAVDFYLRAGNLHLVAWTQENHADLEQSQQTMRRQGEGAAAAEGARQALLAAEEMEGVDGNTLTSQQTRRAGAGWFALGTSLVNYSKVDAGLAALVRGCRLLEGWIEAEASHAGVGGHERSPDLVEILRSAQLDLRLSKLSRVLQDSGEFDMAASAAARALAFCPALWCISAEGPFECPVDALLLIERYVACFQRCRRPESPERRHGKREQESSFAGEEAVGATAGELVAYLSDGDDSSSGARARGGSVAQNMFNVLERKGCPQPAMVWALLAECQAYRTHLKLYNPGTGCNSLVRCVEGHRRSTEAVIEICACREGGKDGGETFLTRVGLWEALARVEAARLEHELFLANAKGRSAGQDDDGDAGTFAVLADLPRGILHASIGAEAASKVVENGYSYSAMAAAMAGVCWCIHALLLRDKQETAGNTHRSMQTGLDSLAQAVRNPDWLPKGSWQTALGCGGVVPLTEVLEVLESHFALHGDTFQRVKAGEIRSVITGRMTLASESSTLRRSAADSAGVLSSIGAAYHAVGATALASVYQAAACGKLVKMQDGEGEPARIAVGVLGGLCLAKLRDETLEAENALLEARRAVSDSEPGLINPAMAAYLDCAVGMGLSWIYEGGGRLVEAMGEIRHVLRLCHAWASADGPMSLLDRQVVVLSAAKGTSIHDESCEKEAAASRVQAEEGLGEEDGGVEYTMSNARAMGGGGRDKENILSSRWIRVYLEGLVGMGRLWRTMGFASKASGYLRQGCVASEPLGAASLLRRCLLEEVEVAAGMHRFVRADRLLRASHDLLQQERKELGGAEDSAGMLPCPTCSTIDGANVTRDTAPAQTVTGKGKGSRKGMRKGGGKSRLLPGPTSSSLTHGPCVRCHDLALNAAELSATEACLLRKKGDFVRALAACDQGQTTLEPIINAAGAPPRVVSSLSLAGVSPESSTVQRGGRRGEERQGLGWRAVRILAVLRLQRGRVEHLLGNVTAAREILRECAGMDGAPALVVAAALYRIGRIQLDAGDMGGARPPLEKALALIRGTGAPKLVRNVRRTLVVASAERGGKESMASVGIDGSWDVAALASLSIGVTHCNQVVHAAARRARKGESTHHLTGTSAGLQLFDFVSRGCDGVSGLRMSTRKDHGGLENDHIGGLSRCLQEAIAVDLRAEWPIVTLCLAPGEGGSEHLLLTRLARGRPPLSACIPLSPDKVRLLERWRGIMEENHNTLRGHSAEEAVGWGNRQKADWWERRDAVDASIDSLLGELEEKWFAAHGLSAFLVGEIVQAELASELVNVFDFAKGRINTARRETFASGSNARGRARGRARGGSGKRSRGGLNAFRRSSSGAQEDLSTGLSELIRVCVWGGNVMDEQAWREVVRLCLPRVVSEETVAEISRDIREAITAAFFGAEEHGGRGASGMSVPLSTKKRQASSLDIEGGRSVGVGGLFHAAAPATPAQSSASGSTSTLAERDLSKMKVADLRSELAARGIATAGLKLKADLLARLSEAVQQEVEKVDDDDETLYCNDCDDCGIEMGGGTADSSDESGVSDRNGSEEARGGRVIDRHPVVLVLDERLQALPWEGLPCLRGHAVTRVPAVPFVFSALETRWHQEADVTALRCSRGGTSNAVSGEETAWLPSRDGLRLSRGFYVLDPERNLPHTRQKLGPVFKEIGRRLCWTGVQGTAPTEEDMSRALQKVDIFAYCGHGAGELLVGREAVAKMTRCAAAVLMGCSSGRLKGYGDFEPTGMATSYLMGGSPAVVANLWDVTDRDIDRFSTALFEAFLGSEDEAGGQAPTLAHAVAAARSECKMPFIVGYAPVCYGIPVTVAVAASSPVT